VNAPFLMAKHLRLESLVGNKRRSSLPQRFARAAGTSSAVHEATNSLPVPTFTPTSTGESVLAKPFISLRKAFAWLLAPRNFVIVLQGRVVD